MKFKTIQVYGLLLSVMVQMVALGEIVKLTAPSLQYLTAKIIAKQILRKQIDPSTLKKLPRETQDYIAFLVKDLLVYDIDFALIEAAKNNYSKLMVDLIEDRADINFFDELGNAALLWACRNNAFDAVKVLLDYGAMVDIKNEMGNSPLLLAAQFSEVGILNLLHNAHVDIAIANDQEITPLMAAVYGNKLENVNFLLENGAKSTLEDVTEGSGKTALHYATILATEIFDTEIADLLLQSGADVNKQDNGGYTPLMMGIGEFEDFYLPLIELLLKKGADLEIQDSKGFTALMSAVDSYKPSLPLVTLLLDYKQDLNLRNAEGKTALLLAVENGYVEIARLLLEAGASSTIADNEENTPLSVAREKGFFDILFGTEESEDEESEEEEEEFEKSF